MRGRNLFFTGLIISLVGLSLIVYRHPLADDGVVVAAGTLFVVAGVLNIIVMLASRDREGHKRHGAVGAVFGWIVSAAAVVLGLAMLIFSKAFVAIVGFMLAVLLLFAALFQLFLLIFGTRPIHLHRGFFIVPALLVAAAAYIVISKPEAEGGTTGLIVTGAGLMLFGITTVVEGFVVGNINRRAVKGAKAAADFEAQSSAVPPARPDKIDTTVAVQPEKESSKIDLGK